MAACEKCGHELGVGRFCLNCGHPVAATSAKGGAHAQRGGWRADTAERHRANGADGADGAPTFPQPTPTTTPPPASHRPRHVDESRRGAGSLPWVAALMMLLLVASAGLWLLIGGEDDPPADTTDPRAGQPSPQPSRDPRTPQGRTTVEPLPEVEPVDLAGSATVRAPQPAPDTEDVTGSPVTFAATNLLDGLPETCWRTPGDGTGSTLVFGFDRPVTMTEVGLVNGYAKTASTVSATYDWYAGNRRTLRVEWGFDDGTVVTQDLGETRQVQRLALEEEVETERVTLRLLEVTAPGVGPASRDYTALSEVTLRGAPVG